MEINKFIYADRVRELVTKVKAIRDARPVSSAFLEQFRGLERKYCVIYPLYVKFDRSGNVVYRTLAKQIIGLLTVRFNGQFLLPECSVISSNRIQMGFMLMG